MGYGQRVKPICAASLSISPITTKIIENHNTKQQATRNATTTDKLSNTVTFTWVRPCYMSMYISAREVTVYNAGNNRSDDLTPQHFGPLDVSSRCIFADGHGVDIPPLPCVGQCVLIAWKSKACPRTGLPACRAKPLQHAWARVAREAVGPEGQIVP